jgi:hypothetical protein
VTFVAKAHVIEYLAAKEVYGIFREHFLELYAISYQIFHEFLMT